MIRKIEKLIILFSNLGLLASMGLILAVMFFTTADVTGRIFGFPIPGSYQICELILVWVVCLAWPFSIGTKGHVRVEVLASKFPPAVQRPVELFALVLTLGIFVLLVWQGVKVVMLSIRLNELVSIVEVPLYPFQIVIPLGALLVCPVLLLQIVQLIAGRRKGRA